MTRPPMAMTASGLRGAEAVGRELRGRLSNRQVGRRQGDVVRARQYPDHPSDGRHHHGNGRSQLGRQQLLNLYVAGPGIFTTSGASNPTYTIFALSLRGAEQLASTWSTVAG